MQRACPHDFSTLYTTLPHNLIKEKLLDLIEWTFNRALKNYGSLYLACNDRKSFFTFSDQGRYTFWSCQNVCDALSYLLDNIYIRCGTKLYRQIVGIPMGTNCAPLVADLFLYCYERDFIFNPVLECVFDLDFSCKCSKLQCTSLAFVAGFKRATDEGSLPVIAQYSPYFLPLNVFTASKGPNFYILFAITEAGVLPCGGPKKSPRTSSIVQIIFSFRSFEISKDIQSVQNTHV